MRQLIHGDCRYSLSSLVPDESVDLILCDLPSGRTSFGDDTGFTRPELISLWKEFWRVLRPRGVILHFAVTGFREELWITQQENFRYDLIFEKTNPVGFLNAKFMPLRAHEHILIWYRERGTFNYEQGFTEGVPYTRSPNTSTENYSHLYGDEPRVNTGYRFLRSVLRYSRDNNIFSAVESHPQRKPLELIESLIRIYTNKGDTVLDPTAGSGVVGEAAFLNGRHYILVEKNQRWVERIKRFVQIDSFVDGIFTPTSTETGTKESRKQRSGRRYVAEWSGE
jgi:site-specific DNA-methyltransferase (adenine-specific)